jgi:hypothetical protein
MKLIKSSFYLVFSLILLSSFVLKAEGVEGKDKGKVYKTTGSPQITKFNINNISTFFGNDGISDLNITGDSGFQFPIGSGKTVFYESGFVYGGNYPKADGTKEFRISGSTYNRGQQPGRILPDGTREDQNLPHVRIYRVRPDFKDPNADYSKEIMDEGKTKAAISEQYAKDWNEWPAQYGAPYTDVNKNGQYDPAVDIPGFPGADQTIWFVANDLDPIQAVKLYGSEGLGMEMQATIFGYNQQNALGDALFRKYLLINKSGKNITEFYVCMWSDPDLGGDAGDDLAGVDTLLSLGYIYNGDDTDPSYGQYIPAAGFDFLQGPIVPGTANDQAIFKNKIRKGFKNLPASTFFLFTQSVANWGDPTLGNYTNGALRFRNLFEGKNATLGTPFIDPLTGKVSKFFAPGDPVTGQGWVDGILFPKQDRRIGLVAGPFNIAAGDSQEVVVGQLAAGGVAPVTRLGAVALLKYQDLQVQQAYNNFFQVPTPPKAPIVPIDEVTKIGKATELDQQLIINWYEDRQRAAEIESHNQLGYKFQGYVVYQLPRLNAQLNEGKIVATFDLIDQIGNIESLVFDPETNSTTKRFTKFGNNSGIQRNITITRDLIRGGIPLANGTEYYFVVSAYSYNPDPNAVPNVLETLSSRILAVPHSPNPGTSFPATNGSSITVTRAAGVADGAFTATIVDPALITGNSYDLRFTAKDTVLIGTVKVPYPKWEIFNKEQNRVVVGSLDYYANETASPIVDGVQVFASFSPVWSASKAIASLTYTPSQNMNWNPVNWGGTFFSGGFDIGPNWRGSSLKGFECNKIVEIRFNSNQKQKAYNFLRTAAGTGAAICTGYFDQPFTVWDVTNPAAPRQLMFFFLEASGSTYQNNVWGPGAATGDREYFYILDTPYSSAADPLGIIGKTEGTVCPTVPILYGGWYVLKDATKPPYNNGDVYRIKPTLNPTTTDRWSFTTAGMQPVTNSIDLAKQAVEDINVFPNPYYAVNPREVNKYQRFVTFSHLPAKATIRIFNLAGQLVRSIEKNSPSQFITWDLVNESSFPVASGLYIVHIDLPDLGKTKILKLAVIQEQQILDHY